MNTTSNPLRNAFKHFPKIALTLVMIAMCASPVSAQIRGGGGTIYGRIHDADTDKFMPNAEISVEGLGIATVSEQGGFYTLNNVPEGEVTVVVNYAGYVTEKKTVILAARQQVVLDFEMRLTPSSLDTTPRTQDRKDDIITLDKITVTTERAGNARAFMEQKNSMTMSTILATDSFGTVPNGNIAEFLRNMPGISALEDSDTGEADQISIGGMDASLTGVYLDGARMASGAKGGFDDDSRSFRFDQVSINGVESIELRRTVSADMEGDAPAGGVVMKTKSAFDIKKPIFRYDVFFTANSYSMNLKRTPGPTDGKSYKIRPGVNLTYSTPFNSGKMGILAQLTYQTDYRESNVAEAIPQGTVSMVMDNPFLNSVNFRTSQTQSDRMSGSIRWDWRISPFAKMHLLYSHDERDTTVFSRNVSFDTGRNTTFNTSNLLSLSSPEADTATRNVVNQTARYDQSRSENVNLNFNWKRYGFTLEAVATWSYSIGKKNPTNDKWFSRVSMYRSRSSASSSYSLWGERSSTSKMDWSFYRGDRQTQTPDDNFMAEFGNISSYVQNGTYSLYAALPSHTEQTLPTVKADLRWDAPTKIPLWFKTGINWRQNKTAAWQPQDYSGRELANHYTYVRPAGGDAPAFNSTAYLSQFEFDPHFGGNIASLNIPMLDQTALYSAFKNHYELIHYTDEEGYERIRENPDNWFTQSASDRWNDIIANWTGRRNLSEDVYAGYLMGETRPWKSLVIQAGLRYEYTSQKAVTLIPKSIAMVERALGTKDHYTYNFLSMLYNYGERTTTTNTYSFLLPSAAAKYSFTPNLVGHLAYSEGFGRLSVDKLAANWKVVEGSSMNTARAPNPSLEPDHYKTYSAAIEYYFEPAGTFTFTYTYRKWLGTTYEEVLIENANLDSPSPVLQNLINLYGVDILRGFLDMDYQLVTWQPVDIQDRSMQTLEFSYRQRIPAIPGLQVDANFTRNVPNWRKTGASSAPKLASGGISYSRGNIFLRVSGNWRSRYWQTWSLPSAQLDWKQRVGINARFLLNAELTYRLSRNFSLYTRVDNILNSSTTEYRDTASIVSRETLAGVAFRVGIKGDF